MKQMSHATLHSLCLIPDPTLHRRTTLCPRVQVFCTPSMASFLRNNQPWAQLTERGNIAIRELDADATGTSDASLPVSLTRSISFKPVPVPHRAELSDTVAYVVSVRGGGRPSSSAPTSTKLDLHSPATISSSEEKTTKFLYCPDTDCWSGWARSIRDWCSEVDVALLDATFYSKGELKGRDMSEVSGYRLSVPFYSSVVANLFLHHVSPHSVRWIVLPSWSFLACNRRASHLSIKREG